MNTLLVRMRLGRGVRVDGLSQKAGESFRATIEAAKMERDGAFELPTLQGGNVFIESFHLRETKGEATPLFFSTPYHTSQLQKDLFFWYAENEPE